MKKTLTFALIALAAVFAIAACKTTPPPQEEVAEEAPQEVDTSPPVLAVVFSPQPFSPDSDENMLSVNINTRSASPIRTWNVEIREPEPPYSVFREWSGEGRPPATLVWDGMGEDGDLAQPDSTYPFQMIVSNEHDQAVYQGSILIGARQFRILRIIVPSIMFAPNAGDFRGLEADKMEINDRILRRIAMILEKFDTYSITVEGHANPTTAPDTRARTQEETGTRYVKGLQPLSEERAKAVMNYLVDLGIDRERLTAEGFGSTMTIAEFSDRDNWWKNRRVEFILEK
ncbi:MAG: OmpA family protein [Treponema sp.]|jgi:hypothetical protein|nr:OmpA family protein [Treponema sp.]